MPPAGPDALAEIHRTSDPYPWYAWLRTESPVYFGRSGDALLTRHADCLRVLEDHERFLAPGQEMLHLVGDGTAGEVLSRVMSSRNPPVHTRMRMAVVRRFARHVQRAEPQIAEICGRILDPLAEKLRDGVTVDLHEALSVRVPSTIIMEIVGVPRTDQPRVRALVPPIFQVSGPVPGREVPGDRDQAARELTSYLADLADQRRRAPRPDLASELVAGQRQRTSGLEPEDVTCILTGLTLAGFETTAAGIDNGTCLMTSHPELAGWLRHPAGARRFAEEVLRLDPPIQFTPAPRVPTEPVTVGGNRLPARMHVWAGLGAANRDPAAFPRPDLFDPARDPGRSLAFGAGPHQCFGAGLAIRVISTALRLLHERLPGLTLADGAVPRVGRLRGYRYLPVAHPKDGDHAAHS